MILMDPESCLDSFVKLASLEGEAKYLDFHEMSSSLKSRIFLSWVDRFCVARRAIQAKRKKVPK